MPHEQDLDATGGSPSMTATPSRNSPSEADHGIGAAIAEARAFGWASRQVDNFSFFAGLAHIYGLEPVRNHATAPLEQVLTPKSIAEARPGSMSASVGLGRQPFHTDGAHLAVPPSIVLLYSPTKNSTETLICKLGPPPSSVSDLATFGNFVIRNEASSRLSPAYHDSRWRYDPGCMDPLDGRSRQLVEWIQMRTRSAESFQWNLENSVLIIDNTMCLHARAATETTGSERELLRVCLSEEK